MAEYLRYAKSFLTRELRQTGGLGYVLECPVVKIVTENRLKLSRASAGVAVGLNLEQI
jgi:hypothetical protein